MSGKHVTEEESKEMKKKWNDGLNLGQIAMDMGRTEKTVKFHIHNPFRIATQKRTHTIPPHNARDNDEEVKSIIRTYGSYSYKNMVIEYNRLFDDKCGKYSVGGFIGKCKALGVTIYTGKGQKILFFKSVLLL